MVDELDELLEKRSSGLNVVAGPANTSYQHRILFIKDPAGFMHAYAKQIGPYSPECTDAAKGAGTE